MRQGREEEQPIIIDFYTILKRIVGGDGETRRANRIRFLGQKLERQVMQRILELAGLLARGGAGRGVRGRRLSGGGTVGRGMVASRQLPIIYW